MDNIAIVGNKQLTFVRESSDGTLLVAGLGLVRKNGLIELIGQVRLEKPGDLVSFVNPRGQTIGTITRTS